MLNQFILLNKEISFTEPIVNLKKRIKFSYNKHGKYQITIWEDDSEKHYYFQSFLNTVPKKFVSGKIHIIMKVPTIKDGDLMDLVVYTI